MVLLSSPTCNDSVTARFGGFWVMMSTGNDDYLIVSLVIEGTAISTIRVLSMTVRFRMAKAKIP